MNDVKQVWYTDDASGSGKIKSLCEWWDQLSTVGMKFGYFVNADKTWLVTKKKNYYSKAEAVFAGTGVHITAEGRPYLGAPIGTE